MYFYLSMYMQSGRIVYNDAFLDGRNKKPPFLPNSITMIPVSLNKHDREPHDALGFLRVYVSTFSFPLFCPDALLSVWFVFLEVAGVVHRLLVVVLI